MSASDDSNVVNVFPLDGSVGGEADPWRLAAEGKAVLIEELPGKRLTTSRNAPPVSMLGQGLLPLINQIDAGRGTLMRVQAPTGESVRDLARASGGGYRGFTQSADTGRLAGHARLYPVNKGVRVATAATAMVVAGAEIISNHEMHQKLDRLDTKISQLLTAEHDKQDADVRQAAAAVDDAYRLVSSGGLPPTSLGLDSSAQSLGKILHQEDIWVERLDEGLTRIQARIDSGDKVHPDGIHLAYFAEDIGMKGLERNGPAELLRRSRLYLRAIAVENRLIALTSAETQLRNPDVSLVAFESAMSNRLARNARRQDTFARVMRGLASEPLTLGLTSTLAKKSWQRQGDVSRAITYLALELNRPAPLPALLSGNGNQVLYVRSTDEGLQYALPST